MTAIRPSSFQELRSLDEQEDILPVKEKEDSLAFVAKQQGWKELTDYMDQLLDELDQMVAKALENGMSFEEIGKRTAVKELTKDAIRKIRARVDDARVAQDSRTERGAGL